MTDKFGILMTRSLDLTDEWKQRIITRVVGGYNTLVSDLGNCSMNFAVAKWEQECHAYA